jgi:hypothetical protein
MNELKDYLLDELTPDEKRRVEERLAADGEYRQEFERLRMTQTALLAAPGPEMPRRIAFVSDPVFESKPSFWSRLFAPTWAYGCAALLSVAILGHGWISSRGSSDEAMINARIDKAVAEIRAEQDRRHAQFVRSAEDAFQYLRERSLRVERASYVTAGEVRQ